ncbi:hypothetical protein Pcar_3429 [Syntrophotalea carbinolica DSM 2380]|uniref:Uncharacterized protein n=1 Tax=Syntrophotalea carbinolica (strain DSM 2380 / NBRC 103641 / GraBd1) TaxID=338963 RepID=J9UI30_SYNC1|nr:hypothetical protein Pcar_3429 [Syntrophotalea carbinolica DSM 2380]
MPKLFLQFLESLACNWPSQRGEVKALYSALEMLGGRMGKGFAPGIPSAIIWPPLPCIFLKPANLAVS